MLWIIVKKVKVIFSFRWLALSPRDFLITLGDKLMQTNMVNNIHHDNQSMINPSCVDNSLADGYLEVEKQLGKVKAKLHQRFIKNY